MVEVAQIEEECRLLRQNTSSELSKCQVPFQVNLSDIRTDLYLFGDPAKGSGVYGAFTCTFKDGQSFFEALLLSQWEDHAWKGQVSYDVATCEIKVVSGGKKFIAQLNEKWNLNHPTELGNEAFQPLRLIKSSYMKTHSEDILFCVAKGESENSELISSTTLPKDGILVIINVNPVEYGHVFLEPYGIHQMPWSLNKRTYELITLISAEMNSCSFRIFYDYDASMNSDHIYFQGCHFAGLLPVELLPTITIYGNLVTEGIYICEVADYPLKALVFMCNNFRLLAEVVAEIFSILQDQDTAFNLLISDCGSKVFLFPQVHVAGRYLSAWECGGYFIYNKKSEFNLVSEVEIQKQMASVSLDNDGFEALKQLCCSVAAKLSP